MTFETWRRRVSDIAAELRTEDVRSQLLQNRLEFALARLWRAMQDPPQAVRIAYQDISPNAMEAAARTRVAGLARENAPVWEPELGSGATAAVLAVASEIRALDQALFECRDPCRSDDPNVDFLAFRDESLFILPRVAGSVPQGRRGQEFARRGLIHHRILPRQIGELPVQLYTPASRGPGMDGSGADLVSAMFAAVVPELSFDEGRTTFRVERLINAPQLHEALTAQLDELAAAEGGCMAAVWPELAVSPDLLENLIVRLSDGALDDSAPDIGFVVAGSWHVPRGDGYFNLGPVLDGMGRLLLEIVKRERFELEAGVMEQINPGEEVPILVYGDVLFAFGICKDFCERRHPTPYPDLDVDFVVVPSFGTGSTMEEHLVAAGNLDVVYGARSFVVQQYLPSGDDAVWGAILRPAAASRGHRVGSSMQKKLLHRTRVSCVRT